MKIKAIVAIAAAFVVAVVSTGCGGGGGSDTRGSHGEAWYDVYGDVCGYNAPSPGCNFYWDGTKIIDVEDDYFATDYNLEWDLWIYTDEYGFDGTYTGWAWWSPSDILYDDLGNALNKLNTQKVDRNILKKKAQRSETLKIKQAGKRLVEEYGHLGLSSDAGMHIARTLNKYANLQRNFKVKQSITMADEANFTKQLYGVELGDAMATYKAALAGDFDAAEATLDKVSNYWNSTPEATVELISEFQTDLADALLE